MEVNTAPAPKTAMTTSSSGGGAAGDLQMFLKMLTAQLKNQNPLNPIDSSDYAVQLATFSGVEQQVKTNELLNTLASQMHQSGLGQFASWVGMEARAPGAANYSGFPITVYPAPPQNADQSVLVAYDAQGREVSRQEIPVTADPVTWTGTSTAGLQVPHGAYTFRLESFSGGLPVANDPVELFARITEIRQGPDGAMLVTEGGSSLLPSQVRALRPVTGG